MKIIHTADWHLGQLFYNYDRSREHEMFLQWLKSQIHDNAVDVLLIAGDVFDTQNPSAASQSIYYHFLRDVTYENPDLQVIVIAGNHDSAGRLEAPNPLLDAMNVKVRGVVRRNADGAIDFDNYIVPLNRGGYCVAVPYLRQGDLISADNNHSVASFYGQLRSRVAELHPDAWPVIAMGHLYVAGAKVLADDESENIFIGNLQGVESGIFDGFTYTALGHLHRRQSVDDKSVVRYAGAPLPMSFTERHYDQGVELIETDSEAHTVSVTSLHFDAPVKLHSIDGDNLDEVIQKINELPDKDGSEDENLLPVYDVTVKVDAYSSSVKDSVIEALSPKAVRLAKISLQLNSEVQSSSDISIKEAQTMKPIDMAKMCYKDQLGTDMPLNLCSLMEKVIDEVVEQ